jgi:hypothetical protein
MIKKHRRHYTLFVFIITLLATGTACNYSGKLTRRYKSFIISPQACNIANYVSVNASVPDKDPSATPAVKALHDLSPRGQSALIEALSRKEANSADLIARLRTDLAVPPDKTLPDIIDFTHFSKRILAVIQKIPVQEGDRIEKVIIRITVNDPHFIIRSCNKIVTEYMNVDVGKISYSNNNAFELSGNAGTGAELTATGGTAGTRTSSQTNNDETLGSERTSNNGFTSKATASQGVAAKFNASRSMSEEVQLRQRLVALNAFIKDNQLFLYQESVSGIDLTGNILSDIVGEYVGNIKVDKVISVDKLSTPAGFAAQAAIEIKENYIQSPNIAADITATIKFESVYRRIDKGDKTISEADDDISLLHGSTLPAACPGETFVLVPGTALRPNTWKLTYFDAGSGVRLPLHIIDGPAMGGDLLFSSYNNAVDFLRWLKRGANNYTINLSSPIGTKDHLLKQGDNVTAPTVAQINSLQLELN